MKRLISILLLLCTCMLQTLAQTATEIKQQISKIRRETKWDNPAAAQKANEQINALSKKLYLAERSPAVAADTNKAKMDEKALDEKFKMTDQVASLAAKGKKTDVDMAEFLREEIKEAYKEDENPRINPQVMEVVDYLVLNMSLPHVDKVIEQMPNFKNIHRLVITAYAPVPVDLSHILQQAVTYPLEELYVFNFQGMVSNLPAQVAGFKQLKILQLSNNRLKQIPASLSACTSLQELYIDFNPTQTLMPVITSLKQLQKLGVEGTAISASELNKISASLPNCKILQQ
jgi:Leucine-rich repeat (LRR) protein